MKTYTFRVVVASDHRVYHEVEERSLAEAWKRLPEEYRENAYLIKLVRAVEQA